MEELLYDTIFEDDNSLIVSPLNYVSNKYFGKNTEFDDGNFIYPERFFDNLIKSGSKLYYAINKKSGDKIGFFVKNSKIYTEQSYVADDEDINSIIEIAPNAESIIRDLSSPKVFSMLKQYAKGKISERVLLDSDDSIYQIIPNKESRVLSEIIISFNSDEDFLVDILKLSDDDYSFIYYVFTQRETFIDSNSLYYDNKEGLGIFSTFDDENRGILEEISKIILPKEKVNLYNEYFLGRLYTLLQKLFPSEIDSMDDFLVDHLNEKAQETAEKDILNEISKYLNTKKIKIIKPFTQLKVTVSALLLMYTSKLGMTRLNLFNLLRDNLNGSVVVGIHNDRMEYLYHNTDDNYLNQFYNDKLNDILDNLILNKLNNDQLFSFMSKFEINQLYRVPKNELILFKISNFDLESGLISVSYKKNNAWESHKFTAEDLNNFLYHPELFDE